MVLNVPYHITSMRKESTRLSIEKTGGRSGEGVWLGRLQFMAAQGHVTVIQYLQLFQ